MGLKFLAPGYVWRELRPSDRGTADPSSCTSAGATCAPGITSNTEAAQRQPEVTVIFLILFVVLLLAWIFSWAIFHVAGGLLHILLIVAVISLILHFVRGRRTVA